MEARVNSPFHEQPTKQSLPVLHKSGLAESSKKAVLGSTENTLGRSGTDAGKGKGKGKSRDKRGQSRVTGQPTSSSTSQAGMRLHKPRPVPARCTSRDHESDKFPKKIGAWVPMRRTTQQSRLSVARTWPVVVCCCWTVEQQAMLEASKRSKRFLTKHKKRSEQNANWVSFDTHDRRGYKHGDGKRKQPGGPTCGTSTCA